MREGADERCSNISWQVRQHMTSAGCNTPGQMHFLLTCILNLLQGGPKMYSITILCCWNGTYSAPCYQIQKASEMLLKMEIFCAFDANETWLKATKTLLDSQSRRQEHFQVFWPVKVRENNANWPQKGGRWQKKNRKSLLLPRGKALLGHFGTGQE